MPTTPGPGRLSVMWMEDGAVRELGGAAAAARLPAIVSGPDAAAWIDLVAPNRGQVQEVGGILGLHPLIVEDVLEGGRRPKVDVTDATVHVVLIDLAYRDSLVATEVDLVLGSGFLLTVHDAAWRPWDGQHLQAGPGPLLARGPDHVLWALCDDLVDGYFPMADALGDVIDEIQDEVVRGASPEALERLFRVKRELHDVRRAIGPVRDVFNRLTDRDSVLIGPDELAYFRDVYDHVVRLTDELDDYREMVSSTLEVHLTQVNNSLSVIMKRLTGVTVVLAGIGAIAGLFGMSEAGTALAGGESGGFWLVVAVTLLAAAAGVIVLRRIDWI